MKRKKCCRIVTGIAGDRWQATTLCSLLLVISNAIQGAHGSRIPSQIANNRVPPPLIGVVEAPDVRFTTAPESTLR